MKGIFSMIGSVAAGVFSSACCLGPAIFASLGIGAGTAGALGGLGGFIKALIPYRPLFIISAAGFLAFGFFLVYGWGRKACVAGDAYLAKRLKRQKIALWATSVVVVILILSPYWLALFG